MMRKRLAVAIIAMALAPLLLALSAPVGARTISVVTFGSKQGIVIIDSNKSIAAYRLFESINAPVTTEGLRQTKILAPEDGLFRIACSAVGADYGCAVIVYASEHADLDFDTDRVELHLPAAIAKRYAGLFATGSDRFQFETEDGQLTITWAPDGLHIVGAREPNEEVENEDI